jgi:hypothetical protein
MLGPTTPGQATASTRPWAGSLHIRSAPRSSALPAENHPQVVTDRRSDGLRKAARASLA